MKKKIILASASPRRKDLLENIHLEFTVMTSDTDETLDEKFYSKNVIEKLALQKAEDVKNKVNYPAIIIGADTVVVVDGLILGKPKDDQDAFRMLTLLSGKTHQVISAIAIVDTENNKTSTDSVTSDVTFRKLTDDEIYKYIETKEPADKAGAYAIQGYGAVFVSSISGCYSNIVGISLFKLAQMLKDFGIKVI
jgi:septum formation protein